MQAEARARAALFEGLDAATLDEISAQMQPRRFDAHETICREGEPGESLFVIESGLAQVMVGRPAGPQLPLARATVARLRRGDVVGEMALVTGEPRSATVIANVPTEALELRREAFARILARSPAMLANLNRILSRRLARTTAGVQWSERPRRGEVVALVTGGRGATLAAEVVAATQAASPRSVVALDLTASEPPVRPLAPNLRLPTVELPTVELPTVEAALTVLDDLLPAHDVVVIVADSGQDDLPLLLEQVDRVVAVIDRSGAGRLAALFATPDAATERVEVVLLTDGPGPAPAATAGLRVVRACDPDGPDRGRDIAWLGRHLARTKLGLALGAGGAKGYAHVGALQVLEEAGYSVDYVAGSSIGAVVGSWLALGQDAAAIERTMREAFIPEAVGAMFKLSLSGLSSGLEVHARMCRETTGDRSFADLAIPLVAMAVDLTTRQPAPVTTGPLWQALLAATALPGLFPPYERDGQRLVDGLCLIPVPSDAAREAGADIIVAVNILSRETLPAWPGETMPPPAPGRSGSRMLDTLLEVMDLSQLDASVRHAARADVTITPRFGPGTWRDFHLADLFLAAGRAAAGEQLATLRGLARPQH